MVAEVHDLIADQYLEVVPVDGEGWVIIHVIESLPAFVAGASGVLRTKLASASTLEDGEQFLESFRFLYDRSIFKYELM